MKNILRLGVIILTVLTLGACGGNVDLSCDEVQTYQLAEVGKRVEVPEDLDDLDPLREVPLPEAAPRDAREEGARCRDRPPLIIIQADS